MASELALAGSGEQFAVLMAAGVFAWFPGLGLVATGALYSLWLFVSEGAVVAQRVLPLPVSGWPVRAGRYSEVS